MKIILTGATGYVGEGTLLELLKVDAVEKVLSVSRRPTGIRHEKLEEYLVKDFMELKEGDAHFSGYDAVFFIAGISSIGAPEDVYRTISYDIPTHFADIMPGKENMTFIYLSGAGTNPNGRQWWMKIKGATEQYIAQAGFRYAFAYRPAFMRWAKGQRHIQKMQYVFWALFPVFKLLGLWNTMSEVGRAMIAVSEKGYPRHEIEVRDSQYAKAHESIILTLLPILTVVRFLQ